MFGRTDSPCLRSTSCFPFRSEICLPTCRSWDWGCHEPCCHPCGHSCHHTSPSSHTKPSCLRVGLPSCKKGKPKAPKPVGWCRTSSARREPQSCAWRTLLSQACVSLTGCTVFSFLKNWNVYILSTYNAQNVSRKKCLMYITGGIYLVNMDCCTCQ